MKVTAEDLRRIINETIADRNDYEDAISTAAERISSMFGEDMLRLFQEDPEMFTGRSTQGQWSSQVNKATSDLVTDIQTAIEKAVEGVETRLHDGQYHKGEYADFGSEDDGRQMIREWLDLYEAGRWADTPPPRQPRVFSAPRPDGPSLPSPGPMGSHMGRDQWNNYRMQHVEELAGILEQYPDMAETETDLREYWEGVVGDALKQAFLGDGS